MISSERALNRGQSRAEEVRSRRVRRKKAVNAVKSSRSVKGRRQQTHRYRYETTVRLEDRPQVRLPIFPAINLKARMPTFLLLGIVIWQITRLMTLSTFHVDEVTVNGSHFMSPSRIRALANVTGKTIFEVDPLGIARSLESIPEILSAKVSVKWPNSVVINLMERKPILEWDDAGEIWHICGDGLAYYRQENVLGLVQVRSLTPVLEIGEPLESVLTIEMIEAVKTLSGLIGEDEILFYDPDYGFGFQDDRGWMAYFGSSGNMETKTKLYDRIAGQLAEMSYPASLVSVADLKVPFYR